MTFGIARSWKAEAVVVSAIRESWDRLQLAVDHPAHARARSTSVSRADQRVLRVFAEEAPFRAQALTSLRRLPPGDAPPLSVEPQPLEAAATVVNHERYEAGPFEAGDIPLQIRTNRPELAARVAAAFGDLRVDDLEGLPVVFEALHRGAPPPAHPWDVWRDGEPRQMTVSDDYVVVYLLWEINRLMFERTGSRVHLHGAALVHAGRAVVLARQSHAGKSTLAAWLTHRGWGFLTDEAALVDPDTLIVAPYWRPIGIRRPGPLDAVVSEHGPENHESDKLVPASAIGALAPASPIARLVFPSLAPREPAELSPVSPPAALMELTQHFPGLVADGRAGFRRLVRLVETVPAYKLQSYDLDDAERTLRTLLDELS